MVNPYEGVRIKAFKAHQGRAHPFLWRVERELPPVGIIGIFRPFLTTRDVPTVKVGQEPIASRSKAFCHDQINDQRLSVESGTVLTGCFLHIFTQRAESPAAEGEAGQPTKYWK